MDIASVLRRYCVGVVFAVVGGEPARGATVWRGPLVPRHRRDYVSAMMNFHTPSMICCATAAAFLGASPVLAEDLPTGDPDAGAWSFERQCVTCHVIADDTGAVHAGRTARTGPNLWGVTGTAVASVEGYTYSMSLTAAQEAGAIWDEAAIVPYLRDPTAWLRTVTGDRRARSKMSYRVRSAQDAADIYAYLDSLTAN